MDNSVQLRDCVCPCMHCMRLLASRCAFCTSTGVAERVIAYVSEEDLPPSSCRLMHEEQAVLY